MSLLIIKRAANPELGTEKRVTALRLDFIRSMFITAGRGETFTVTVNLDDAEGGVSGTKPYGLLGLTLKEAHDVIEKWGKCVKKVTRSKSHLSDRRHRILQQQIDRLRAEVTEIGRKRKQDNGGEGEDRRKRQEVESSSSSDSY